MTRSVRSGFGIRVSSPKAHSFVPKATRRNALEPHFMPVEVVQLSIVLFIFVHNLGRGRSNGFKGSSSSRSQRDNWAKAATVIN